MNLRVTRSGEAKRKDARSRSESELENSAESARVDAKPSDLPLGRLKDR